MKEEIVISLKDISLLYKKMKRPMKRVAFLVGSFTFLWLLLQPLQYTTKASLRLAGKQTDSLKLKELFLEANKIGPSGSIAILTSDYLLGRSLENLGKQIEVDPSGKINKFFSRAFFNLLEEVGLGSFRDDECLFSHVHYEGEKKSFFLS